MANPAASASGLNFVAPVRTISQIRAWIALGAIGEVAFRTKECSSWHSCSRHRTHLPSRHNLAWSSSDGNFVFTDD